MKEEVKVVIKNVSIKHDKYTFQGIVKLEIYTERNKYRIFSADRSNITYDSKEVDYNVILLALEHAENALLEHLKAYSKEKLIEYNTDNESNFRRYIIKRNLFNEKMERKNLEGLKNTILIDIFKSDITDEFISLINMVSLQGYEYVSKSDNVCSAGKYTRYRFERSSEDKYEYFLVDSIFNNLEEKTKELESENWELFDEKDKINSIGKCLYFRRKL